MYKTFICVCVMLIGVWWYNAGEYCTTVSVIATQVSLNSPVDGLVLLL